VEITAIVEGLTDVISHMPKADLGTIGNLETMNGLSAFSPEAVLVWPTNL